MILDLKFVFFGTDQFSVDVLEELSKENLWPEIIICPPDRPKGRNLVLSAPPVKVWANRQSIKVLQPEKLDSNFINLLTSSSYQLFIVASYGKLIPQTVLNMPKFGTLNVHPSLLPKYRGTSPIEYQILNDETEVGVSIMLLDEEMDHGPILVQEKIKAAIMPLPSPVLSKTLANIGGRLLAKIIPGFLDKTVIPIPQAHEEATYTFKITKEDGLVDLANEPRKNYLKYLAYQGWPGTYFFTEHRDKKVRVIIKEAHFANNEFTITKVIPEGGHEMTYVDFQRGL